MSLSELFAESIKVGRGAIVRTTVIAATVFLIAHRASAAPKEIMLPPRDDYQHNGKVEVDEDKFSNTQQLILSSIKVPTTENSTRCNVNLYGYFTWKNGKPQPDPTIAFLVSASEWVNIKRFSQLRENEMTFLVDGEKLTKAFAFDTDVGRGYVAETCAMKFPLDELARLVNADKVEIQIGIVEFEFDENTRNALRDWTSRFPRQVIGNYEVKDDPEAVKRVIASRKKAAEKRREAAEEREVEAQLAGEQKKIELSVRNEKVASGKLRIAKKYKEQGRDDLYKATLTDLVASYSGTEAAKEGQKILKEIGSEK